MITKEAENQFFALKGIKPTHRISMGGKKIAMANFPKETKDKLMNRLAEKDEVIKQGQLGILPGIKIDGKQVTKDNIHDFELKPKKEEPKKDIKKKK